MISKYQFIIVVYLINLRRSLSLLALVIFITFQIIYPISIWISIDRADDKNDTPIWLLTNFEKAKIKPQSNFVNEQRHDAATKSTLHTAQTQSELLFWDEEEDEQKNDYLIFIKSCVIWVFVANSSAYSLFSL